MLWSSIIYEYVASLDSSTLSRRCNTARFSPCVHLCACIQVSAASASLEAHITCINRHIANGLSYSDAIPFYTRIIPQCLGANIKQ